MYACIFLPSHNANEQGIRQVSRKISVNQINMLFCQTKRIRILLSSHEYICKYFRIFGKCPDTDLNFFVHILEVEKSETVQSGRGWSTETVQSGRETVPRWRGWRTSAQNPGRQSIHLIVETSAQTSV